MADTKITALAAITTVDPAADVLPIVDISDTSMAASGTTKKITSNQILGAGGTATLASATISGDLTVDTSTLKVDSANNRVGIGTATPALPLDVVGGMQVTSGSAGGLYQWAYGASASSRSWRAWNDVSANGDFQISTSTTRTGSTYSDRYRIDVTGVHTWSNTSGTAMTLDSNGLGIGAVPSYKLEVVAPAGDNIVSLFRSGDATAANNAGGGFRSISSATAASRVAQVWLDADGANFSGGDYFFIQKNGNSGTVEFNQSSNAAMTFLTNGTERARFNNTGAFVLAGGTTTANGIGITFPTTQVASSDANTLDDYEEGVWAPTVSGEVNLTSTTFVSARYTKIGRVVTVSGSVTTFIITSNTLAYFALQNLPFTAATIVPGALYNDTRNTSGTSQVAGAVLYGFLPAASGTTSGSAMTLNFSNTYTV